FDSNGTQGRLRPEMTGSLLPARLRCSLEKRKKSQVTPRTSIFGTFLTASNRVAGHGPTPTQPVMRTLRVMHPIFRCFWIASFSTTQRKTSSLGMSRQTDYDRKPCGSRGEFDDVHWVGPPLRPLLPRGEEEEE